MKRWRSLGVLVLAVTAVYLYGFPTATLLYAGAVLLHAGVGMLLTLGLCVFLFHGIRKEGLLAAFGWLLVAAGAFLGVALIYLGTPHRLKAWLYAHIALCVAGLLLLGASWIAERTWLGAGALGRGAGFASLLAVVAAVSVGAWWVRNVSWRQAFRIENPTISPATMNDEGDGPPGKFFPSSAQTIDGKNIPADYFMQSKACQRCHADIYRQWESSAHHFSSFNNQWYRKSIEYMQEVAGVRSSKWCAGCHDPALLYSGLFDTPIKFLKPFMRNQLPEFCAGCHKVHLDVPLNNYRWIRGFNEYDNWQASGVSGQGARSFYYPATAMICSDCHMPMVPSRDDGNIDGYVHSHRFPGANTAVPVANEDPVQLEASKRFLED